MNRNIENIDDLIGKLLSGDATPEEQQLVERWVNEDPENEKYFQQLKTIFDKAAQVKDWQEFDTDKAWAKLKANLSAPAAKVVSIKQKPSSNLWYRAAAAVLVLLAAGLYFWSMFWNAGPDPVQVVAETTTLADTLPNGSRVFLNKKTVVAYKYDRKKKTHEVSLRGEAYFNVENSKREEFLVDAGQVFIKDIGTAFNVRAYPDSDEIEVFVEEGEVLFFTRENAGVHVKANGRAVFNKKTKEFSVEEADPNATAYKTRTFVFAGTPLGVIADQLNAVYDTKIRVADHLKGCTLTVNFQDEPVEEVAAIIAETLGLEMRTEVDTIILEGDGCQ